MSGGLNLPFIVRRPVVPARSRHEDFRNTRKKRHKKPPRLVFLFVSLSTFGRIVVLKLALTFADNTQNKWERTYGVNSIRIRKGNPRLVNLHVTNNDWLIWNYATNKTQARHQRNGFNDLKAFIKGSSNPDSFLNQLKYIYTNNYKNDNIKKEHEKTYRTAVHYPHFLPLLKHL